MSSNIRSLKKTTVKLLRWHRRIGLILGLLIVLLAVTGILINHTHSLKLSSVRLNNSLLLSWYGLENDDPIKAYGFSLGNDNWFSQFNNQLYMNHAPITECASPLHGAVEYQQYYLALCQDQLLLLTRSGDVLETITPAFGLPADVRSITNTNYMLYLLTSSGILTFNPDTLTASIEPDQNIHQWPEQKQLPDYLQEAIYEEIKASITLETLLLDIHSGRILGNFGVYLTDLAGIMICLLALSGLWAWLNHKRILGKKRQ